jgi:membrane protein
VPRRRPRTHRLRRAVALPWGIIRDWLRLIGRSFWRGSIEFYNSDDLTYAASVAYYGLLSLFPFCLLAFAILGSVSSDVARRTEIVNFVLRYFPTRFEFLSEQLDALQRTRFRIGIGGAAAMVWAALGVFSAISSAVNHAWGVEKQRSYVKHKLFSFFMLLAAGALLVLALVLLSLFQIVRSSTFAEVSAQFPAFGSLDSFIVKYGATLILTVVVGLIYYFVPNAKVRFLDVWPGAIVTGVLWHVTLDGFSYYVRDMTRFNLVHGSIAAVVVFLVWVYTCAVVLLYGVEFTAAYARLRRGRSEDAPAAPTPRT